MRSVTFTWRRKAGRVCRSTHPNMPTARKSVAGETFLSVASRQVESLEETRVERRDEGDALEPDLLPLLPLELPPLAPLRPQQAPQLSQLLVGARVVGEGRRGAFLRGGGEEVGAAHGGERGEEEVVRLQNEEASAPS